MHHRSVGSVSLVLLLVLSGCAGLFSGGTPTETGGAGPQNQTGFTYPAGFNETGVTDSQAALRGHTKGVLEYESFTVTYRATVETPNRTVNVNVTQAVNTAERRALWVTTIGPREKAQYYANGTVYVRTDVPGTNTSYYSRQRPLKLETVSGRRFVGPVIANASYEEATTVEAEGEQLVQYESSNLTSTTGLFGENVSMADVSGFSAKLRVGSDGVVRRAEYHATVDSPTGTRKLTVVVGVSDINATRVRRPNWVDKAESS